MKLNLCIDIDGTITGAYYWLDIANRYFEKNIKPSEVKVYDIHEVLKVPRQVYLKFYEMYGEEIHTQADLRQNAKEVLWKLNQKHNLYYITAREKRLEEVTKGWFHRNALPQGELYLLGSHYKVNQAKKLSCDIFIEDRYENAIQLALAGFEVLLMDCNYNRLPLIPGITRVYNWKEVYKVIEEYIASLNEKSAKIA